MNVNFSKTPGPKVGQTMRGSTGENPIDDTLKVLRDRKKAFLGDRFRCNPTNKLVNKDQNVPFATFAQLPDVGSEVAANPTDAVDLMAKVVVVGVAENLPETRGPEGEREEPAYPGTDCMPPMDEDLTPDLEQEEKRLTKKVKELRVKQPYVTQLLKNYPQELIDAEKAISDVRKLREGSENKLVSLCLRECEKKLETVRADMNEKTPEITYTHSELVTINKTLVEDLNGASTRLDTVTKQLNIIRKFGHDGQMKDLSEKRRALDNFLDNGSESSFLAKGLKKTGILKNDKMDRHFKKKFI